MVYAQDFQHTESVNIPWQLLKLHTISKSFVSGGENNLTPLILIHWPCLGYEMELLGKKVVSQDALEEEDQGVTLLQLQPGHTITHPV